MTTVNYYNDVTHVNETAMSLRATVAVALAPNARRPAFLTADRGMGYLCKQRIAVAVSPIAQTTRGGHRAEPQK